MVVYFDGLVPSYLKLDTELVALVYITVKS